MAVIDKSSPHQKTYTIFLGLQFVSGKNFYKRTEIIQVVSEAVELAQNKLRKKFPAVKLKLQHELTKLGKPVNAQIVRMVKNSAAGLFEVSERNPNVYFELGLIYCNRDTDPLILLNNRAARKKVVASDVQDLFRLQYPQSRFITKKREIANHISDQIARQIHTNRYDIRRIWGGGSLLSEIIVVCPTLPTAYIPKHARHSSSEFVNLAKYGDPDALVEVLILLRTLYPKIKIERFTSKKFDNAQFRKNLIIIGGPDFNKIAQTFMKESKSPIQYKNDSKGTAFVDNKTKKIYRLQEKNQGQKIEDFGLFARFPNPFDRSKTVTMIGGLGTYGVLCAVEAFGNHPTGKKNTNIVIDKISENPYFVALIPIHISRGVCPYCHIDKTTLYSYPWMNHK